RTPTIAGGSHGPLKRAVAPMPRNGPGRTLGKARKKATTKPENWGWVNPNRTKRLHLWNSPRAVLLRRLRGLIRCPSLEPRGNYEACELRCVRPCGRCQGTAGET